MYYTKGVAIGIEVSVRYRESGCLSEMVGEVPLYVYHYNVHAINECVGCLIVMVYT